MSVKLYSQSSSEDSSTIAITHTEMDTITVRMYRLEHLGRYSKLLELNVANLKLAQEDNKSIIAKHEKRIANDSVIIQNQENMIIEFKRIVDLNDDICSAEKKGIRKRLLMFGGGGTLAGFVFAIILNSVN